MSEKGRARARQRAVELGGARVHAVRRLLGHRPADDAQEHFAIELTFEGAPAAWSPFDLAIVNEGPGHTAHVTAARVWADDAWQDVGGDMLEDQQRVRIVVALPVGAGGERQIWWGEGPIGRFDLARAGIYEPDEAEEAFDQSGECLQCGNFTLIGASGYCRPCKGQPTCVVHEGEVSAGRCMGCRQPHCRACLRNGFCDPCRESAATRGPARGGRGGPGGALADGARKARRFVIDRRKQLIGAVVVAVALKGAHLGYEMYTEPVVELSEAQLAVRGIQSVVGGVNALRQQGGLPKGAAEISAFLTESGMKPVPAIVDAGKTAPNAVVYAPKGEHFRLVQLDAEGKPAEFDGKPVAYDSATAD